MVSPSCFPGGQVPIVQDGMKLASTGSIFLATGGTTSSSSQNSSLHKGAGEAHITAEGADNVHVDTDDLENPSDPNSVSPYASTSLIEQLRRGGAGTGRGTFPDVIPPPPRYPPPPVPQDSPPATPVGPGAYQAYQAPPQPAEECHYAQSDLQKGEDVHPAFVGAYGTAARAGGGGGYVPTANGYPQEQYWASNGAPAGMCYMQQPVASLPSQSKSNFFC